MGTKTRKTIATGGRRPIVNGLYRWRARAGTTTIARVSDTVAYCQHGVRGERMEGSSEYRWSTERCACPVAIETDDAGGVDVRIGDGKCEWCNKRASGFDSVIARPKISMAALMMILGQRTERGGALNRVDSLEVITYNPKRQWRFDENIGEKNSLLVTLKFALGDAPDDEKYQKYTVELPRDDEKLSPPPELVNELKRHIEIKSLEKLAEPPSYEDTAKAVARRFRESAAEEIGGAEEASAPASGGTPAASKMSPEDALAALAAESASPGGAKPAASADTSTDLTEAELEQILQSEGIGDLDD